MNYKSNYIKRLEENKITKYINELNAIRKSYVSAQQLKKDLSKMVRIPVTKDKYTRNRENKQKTYEEYYIDNMKKWEYLIFSQNTLQGLINIALMLGEEDYNIEFLLDIEDMLHFRGMEILYTKMQEEMQLAYRTFMYEYNSPKLFEAATNEIKNVYKNLIKKIPSVKTNINQAREIHKKIYNKQTII